MKINYPPGATPLNREEKEGLKRKHVSTREELDELEQANILKARAYFLGKHPKNILTEKFLRDLHRKMFADVWRWAGSYRTSDKNIGAYWQKIPEEVHKLLGDVQYWIDNKTDPHDSIAIRFHHRLVWIHPFPNGNGRHARLVTDLLLESIGAVPFSWGAGGRIQEAGEARQKYLEALRQADEKKYGLLLNFARS